MFGVILLVCCYMQCVVGVQFGIYQCYLVWLYDVLFVVFFFVLWIGEIELQLVQGVVWNVQFEDVYGVVVVGVQIVQVVFLNFQQQGVDIGLVYFDVDKVFVWFCFGYVGQGLVYVVVDFQNLRCLVVKFCLWIQYVLVVFQVIVGLQCVQCFVLVMGKLVFVQYEIVYLVYYFVGFWVFVMVQKIEYGYYDLK